jgi:hypothetical protein
MSSRLTRIASVTSVAGLAVAVLAATGLAATGPAAAATGAGDSARPRPPSST